MTEESTADRVYTWTVRSLYAAAIALNVWLLLETLQESPEGQVILEKLRELQHRALAPVRERKAFRRAANRMLLDAMIIVGETETEERDG